MRAWFACRVLAARRPAEHVAVSRCWRTKAALGASRIAQLSKSFYSTAPSPLCQLITTEHRQAAIFRQDYPPGSPITLPFSWVIPNRLRPSFSFTCGFILLSLSLSTDCAHFHCSLFLPLVSPGKTSSLRYLLARRVLPRQWKYCLRPGEQVPRY